MARLTIHTLGSFQVSIESKPITKFESNKARALLAYLSVESSHSHAREKLADLFWPDLPLKRACSNLSQALFSLRQLLGDHSADRPYFLRGREAVQFNPESDYWLDVQAFSAWLEKENLQDRSQCETRSGYCQRLEDTVALYRGDFLEGLAFNSSLAFDEWVMVMRHRLQRLALEALKQLADCYTERSEIARALTYAWRQVELDPLSESACRQLMLLLAASGQRSLALAQFERLQVILAEELAVAPEMETVQLWEHLKDAGHLPTLSERRSLNLPAFLTPLIGRQTELAEVQQLLWNTDCRLLTISGPGGSGKTRLALEVATSSREAFDQGVFFVSLNPVQSPTSILPAVVEALGLPRQEGDQHLTQLTNYLRNKRLMLVLDGFEHLLEGAGLLAEILHGAPGLKLLVTSRIRLNIQGEHQYPLKGLRYPPVGAGQAEILSSEAVQLLIYSLRRTRLEYQPLSDDFIHLLQVCQQLQGMPLGILLAASWGGTLSLDEIAGEVGRGFDFLSADWADIPTRQRSMRATFDHTWNLLGERERTVFQGLSVFRGAFTRRAACAVSGASSHELRSQVDRSLLWNSAPGWYEVHELLRQYGREKLAQSATHERQVCSRHSTYYLEQLVRLGGELKSAQQEAALSNIDLEHENYRSAWNWAAAQGAAALLAPALGTLCLYYELRLRYAEGESACRPVFEGLADGPGGAEACLLQTRAMIWQSRFTRLLGKPEMALNLLDQAAAHLEKGQAAEDQAHIVEAFLALEKGENHFHNDRAAASSCYLHSLEIYRSMKDAWGAAKVLEGLGFITHHAGNFKEAVEFYSAALHFHRTLGDPRGIANTLIGLGQNTLRQGQVEEGEAFIKEGVAVLEQIGDLAGVVRGWFELARYNFWIGEFAKSCELTENASHVFNELGILDQYTFASIGLGLGLSHSGKYAQAHAAALNGLPLAQKLDARREVGLAYVIAGMACLGLGDLLQARNWAIQCVKQYQDIREREELTLGLAILSYSQRGLGDSQQAQAYLVEILKLGVAISGVYPIMYALTAAALLLLDRGEAERGLEIYALAERYPFVAKSRWFEDIAGREITAVAASLPLPVVTAAQTRGRGRDLWATAGELLDEFAGAATGSTVLF
jgi:predicted ATPase/DNA-binding SARP family transcriptional activator